VDPLGGSNNDYDLFALNSTGTTVTAVSTGNQNGTQDPFEAITAVVAGSRLVIVKFSGVARYLRLTTNRGRLNVNTVGQTTGHSCGLDAFGVAATPAVGPFPNPFTAANQVETFSSDGPRKMLPYRTVRPSLLNASSIAAASRAKSPTSRRPTASQLPAPAVSESHSSAPRPRRRTPEPSPLS
jgi:hypothetical protein